MAAGIGMRFRPTDVEKITILVCKVAGHALPCGDLMLGTSDVYGEKEPWEVMGDSEDDQVCFFTMLKKTGKKRFSRNVGNGGTWAKKGQKTLIYRRGGGGGGLLGYKRCFRYENAKYGTWLLKEYTLPENFHHMAGGNKDYALCVLKRKLGRSKTPPPPQVGFDNNFT